MTQTEKRIYLIKSLLKEQNRTSDILIPANVQEQKVLLRSLFNIRMPGPATEEFLKIQDAYLQNEIAQKGITDMMDIPAIQHNIFLWQGDITTLKCDAIVNAANTQMLGCFCPCHGCIDNAIHTYSGIQLRNICADLMRKQGCQEETGRAKITPAYNLPCRYILHTVGPVIYGEPAETDQVLLASCYRACLELAQQKNLKSVAFCCISTGEFHYPNEKAAQTAIKTVKEFISEQHNKIKVIFNVYKDNDYKIYQKLLSENGTAEKRDKRR